jgi:Resolvase, N terminal domain
VGVATLSAMSDIGRPDESALFSVRISDRDRGLHMRKAVVYLRVSTLDQTTANQERELREVAGRMGCEIVQAYPDHGFSGARGRDKRRQFDKRGRF